MKNNKVTIKTVKISKRLTIGNAYAKPSEKIAIPLLPEGIELADLECPKWNAKGGNKHAYNDATHSSYDFELWHSEGFGWCIPTLQISHRVTGVNRAHSGGERTYAVRVSTGETVRIGNGPHITARVKVYVKVKRIAALQKFFDLQNTGSAKANEIRDNISTRRARSAGRRGIYGW